MIATAFSPQSSQQAIAFAQRIPATFCTGNAQCGICFRWRKRRSVGRPLLNHFQAGNVAALTLSCIKHKVNKVASGFKACELLLRLKPETFCDWHGLNRALRYRRSAGRDSQGLENLGKSLKI